MNEWSCGSETGEGSKTKKISDVFMPKGTRSFARPNQILAPRVDQGKKAEDVMTQLLSLPP